MTERKKPYKDMTLIERANEAARLWLATEKFLKELEDKYARKDV